MVVVHKRGVPTTTRLAAWASVVPAHCGICAVAIKRRIGQIQALSDGDVAIFLPKKGPLASAGATQTIA